MTDPKTLALLLTLLATCAMSLGDPAAFTEFCALAKILIPSFLAANITGEAAKTYVAAKAAREGK